MLYDLSGHFKTWSYSDPGQYKGYITEIIEGQKTVPMMGHFILLAITSILNQITWSWAF